MLIIYTKSLRLPDSLQNICMYMYIKKRQYFLGARTLCWHYNIDFFSLFYYYLKAKIINFTTYKNISADHTTTEFIIIKLIFESKKCQGTLRLTCTRISKWGCYWFFCISVKSDYTFFHERKMSLLLYIKC